PEAAAHVKADEEHDDEVQCERYGDAQHVERELHDGLTFKTEHHENGEQQGDQGDGRDAREVTGFVPRAAFDAHQHHASYSARHERDAEVEHHVRENVSHRHTDGDALQAEQGGKYGGEEPRVDAEEQYLENTVERDKPRGIGPAAARELVPYQDHGDTARKPHDD